LYKAINDEKILNDSFENEQKNTKVKSKFNTKKILDTQMSLSTNLNSQASDSHSESRNKTKGFNQPSNEKKIGISELGIISEETKQNNAEFSDNLSESSSRYSYVNFYQTS